MNLGIILISILLATINSVIYYFYNKRQDKILKEYYEERIKEKYKEVK